MGLSNSHAQLEKTSIFFSIAISNAYPFSHSKTYTHTSNERKDDVASLPSMTNIPTSLRSQSEN